MKLGLLCVLVAVVLGVLLFSWPAQPEPAVPPATPQEVPTPEVPLITAQLEGTVGQVPRAPAPALTPPPSDQPAVPADVNSLQTFGELTMRVHTQSMEIARLKLELEQCQEPDSVLGTLYALPEWSQLDPARRRTVTAFIYRFPVKLVPGEASLIASNPGTAETIAMLGQTRVLAAMGPEAAAEFQRTDPDEFREYFGKR